MTDLLIKELHSDLTIIKNKKKSLKNKFRVGSENDLRNAVELATYLFVLGDIEQSKDLLSSFIAYEYDEEKIGHLIWVHQEGLMLLAYIANIQGNQETEKKLTSIVYSNDFTGPYYNDPDNQYLSSLHEHQQTMEYAKAETKSYKCNAIFVELIRFIYLYEMLPYYEPKLKILKTKVKVDIKIHLKDIVDSCCIELKRSLEDNTRKKQAELDDIWEELNEKYKNFKGYKEVGLSIWEKLLDKLLGPS